ncbi:hypothetical protein [Caballeronia concitans]|uniref:hypothetical protein n=1 Tax=Caballeronia concitans TaxID=1777133 RepID=UPI001FCC77D0|nr:hypothetical protein [Caballeronia concitans]
MVTPSAFTPNVLASTVPADEVAAAWVDDATGVLDAEVLDAAEVVAAPPRRQRLSVAARSSALPPPHAANATVPVPAARAVRNLRRVKIGFWFSSEESRLFLIKGIVLDVIDRRLGKRNVRRDRKIGRRQSRSTGAIKRPKHFGHEMPVKLTS